MLHRLVLWIAVLALGAQLGQAASHEGKKILDAQNMTGWEQVGPGRIVVEDGLLKTEGGMGLFWYAKEKIANAKIRVVWKLGNDKSNGGVFIRIPEKPTEEWMPVHKGYEVQIDNSQDDYHYTGVLYSMTKAKVKAGKPAGEWNVTEITLDGPRTIVHVNGQLVTDFKEGDPVPAKVHEFEPERGPRPIEGYIGLQNHSDKDTVYYKEVTIEALEK